MFHPDDLKSVILLTYLDDAMLNDIAKVTFLKEYASGKYLFKGGEYAEHLYAVIDGKVGLELEKMADKKVLIDTLGRGRTFGFSALVDTQEKKYTLSAKAYSEVKVYTWRGSDLEKRFYENYKMGFLFMKRISTIIKARLLSCQVQSVDIFR